MTSDERNSKRRYDLQDRLIDFSSQVIDVVEELPNTLVGRHIAGQLIRSGTAPASHYGEAQSAESRRDFLHKMKIALKELRETRVWLQLIQRRSLAVPPEGLVRILNESDELISIFVASISTASKSDGDAS